MANPKPDPNAFPFDQIGYWSEIKLEIIEKYAHAYSTILSANPGLSYVYIDGFAGAGEHENREKEIVAGSPTRALQVIPPFREFFFIDLDGDKVENLRRLHGTRKNVHILQGDCNDALLKEVFPKVRYEDYRRGLCLLDPYGLNLRWEVIRKAGAMRTIDLFLNFPIMDANRTRDLRTLAKDVGERAAREGLDPKAAEVAVEWADWAGKMAGYLEDQLCSDFDDLRSTDTMTDEHWGYGSFYARKVSVAVHVAMSTVEEVLKEEETKGIW